MAEAAWTHHVVTEDVGGPQAPVPTAFPWSSLRAWGRRCVRVRTIEFFVADLDAPVRGLFREATPGYSFGEYSTHAISSSRFIEGRARTERYLARIAAGHRCVGFTAIGHHDIAAYLWLSVAADRVFVVPWEFDARFLVPPHTAYVWDCYTAPEHRRRGLYREGLHRVQSLAREAGATLLLVGVAVDNARSMRGIMDTGFTSIGRWTIARVGALMVVTHAGMRATVRFHPATFDLFPADGLAHSRV